MTCVPLRALQAFPLVDQHFPCRYRLSESIAQHNQFCMSMCRLVSTKLSLCEHKTTLRACTFESFHFLNNTDPPMPPPIQGDPSVLICNLIPHNLRYHVDHLLRRPLFCHTATTAARGLCRCRHARNGTQLPARRNGRHGDTDVLG